MLSDSGVIIYNCKCVHTITTVATCNQDEPLGFGRFLVLLDFLNTANSSESCINIEKISAKKFF